MANFTTHCASGILVGGALSTLTIATSVATPGELMTLVFAGALGAVLPDIDLQNSRASQAMVCPRQMSASRSRSRTSWKRGLGCLGSAAF